MSRTDAYRSGWSLILLGAPFVWAGTCLIAKPVESAKRASEWGQRGHQIPEWLQPRPDLFPGLIRMMGALCAAVGTALVATGVMLLLASRR